MCVCVCIHIISNFITISPFQCLTCNMEWTTCIRTTVVCITVLLLYAVAFVNIVRITLDSSIYPLDTDDCNDNIHIVVC